MFTFFERALPLALALLLAVLLMGCGQSAPAAESATEAPAASTAEGTELSAETTAQPTAEPTAKPTEKPKAKSKAERKLGENLSVSADVESLTLAEGEYDYDALLAALPELKALKSLTLEDTALDAAQLAALREAAGEGLTLSYSVEIAGESVPNDAEELDLSALKSGDFDAALEKLSLLENLTSVKLTDDKGETGLKTAQIAALREALPEAALEYSVKLNGKLYASDAESIDLSGLKPQALKRTIEGLKLLPTLKSVELMDEEGECALEKKDVRALMEALPEAEILYSFDFFGTRLSTQDEIVEIEKVKLVEEDEQELRDTLDILPHCTRFVLDNDFRGMSDETYAQIREDYPERGVVWRVYFPGFSTQTSAEVSMLTDEEIVRITFILNDTNSVPLKYCNNAVYVDIGHNSPVSDISFTANMPRLECFIASGSNVHDLTPLAECPNLTWAAFCFCPKVEDLSPLSELPALKYLNVSYTGVKDITAIYGLPLERFVAFHCTIPVEQQEEFVEEHPDCLVGFKGDQPYGVPWRYNEGGAIASNYFEYYVRMRELFIYDDRNYVNNTRNNKYGPGYIELRPYNLVYDENGKLRTTTPYLEQKAAAAAAAAEAAEAKGS